MHRGPACDVAVQKCHAFMNNERCSAIWNNAARYLDGCWWRGQPASDSPGDGDAPPDAQENPGAQSTAGVPAAAGTTTPEAGAPSGADRTDSPERPGDAAQAGHLAPRCLGPRRESKRASWAILGHSLAACVFYWALKVVGWERLELSTNGLKGRCSTIELPTRSIY